MSLLREPEVTGGVMAILGETRFDSNSRRLLVEGDVVRIAIDKIGEIEGDRRVSLRRVEEFGDAGDPRRGAAAGHAETAPAGEGDGVARRQPQAGRRRLIDEDFPSIRHPPGDQTQDALFLRVDPQRERPTRWGPRRGLRRHVHRGGEYRCHPRHTRNRLDRVPKRGDRRDARLGIEWERSLRRHS